MNRAQTTDAERLAELQHLAANLVSSTRDFVFIRREDRMIIFRPNRMNHLNETALFMLEKLYEQKEIDAEKVVAMTAEKYGVEKERIAEDLTGLLKTLAAILSDNPAGMTASRDMYFNSHQRFLPVLSEIALTYRCQNRCDFCYAGSPRRGDKKAEMTTEQVKKVIDRIYDEAKVPTVSLTGGEPTLRKDLLEIIGYAIEKGMRVNLITNGIRSADIGFVRRLADTGLHSAQVSIEGATAELHEAITGYRGSFARTLSGLHNLKAAGIHTHTNTTMCEKNRDRLLELVDFLADQGMKRMSMNMVIRTGGAVGEKGIGYEELPSLLPPVKQRAAERGIQFVWYSPAPYCVFNPVLHGLGGQSCAAADGLLSIAPDGQVLPCSSFDRGFGNLVTEDFSAIWNRRVARYWRAKEFLPPDCRDCDSKDICCGACPLYWDERGSFAEIRPPGKKRASPLANALWRLKRKHLGKLQGVEICRARPSKPTVNAP